MYMSRANVNTSVSPNMFYSKFGDVYKTHKTIWSLFKNDPNKTRDFIFKQDDSTKLPVFYIVSKQKPVVDNNLLQIESKEYNPKLVDGQRLHFSVRVNPIVSLQDKEYVDETGARRRGKHHKHDVVLAAKLKLKSQDMLSEKSNNDIVQEECVAWLARKSKKFGFEIFEDETSVDSHVHIQAYKRKNEDTHKITFGVADISGILKIIDVEKFIDMLYYGIGSEKSFGCGLMLVRQVR